MSDANGVTYTTNSLYMVPTLKKTGDGRESPVWLAPKAITAIFETEVETGGSNGEILASRMKKVTAVITTKGDYFVPLTPSELASRLHLDLVQ